MDSCLFPPDFISHVAALLPVNVMVYNVNIERHYILHN